MRIQVLEVILDGDQSVVYQRNGVRDKNPAIQRGTAADMLTFTENAVLFAMNGNVPFRGWIKWPEPLCRDGYDMLILDFDRSCRMFNGELYGLIFPWVPAKESLLAGYVPDTKMVRGLPQSRRLRDLI